VSFRLDGQTLHVAGEIDMSCSEALRKQLDEALMAGALILDMTGVEFIDSSGIREVLRASAQLNGAGPIRITVSPQVARVFEITGLDRVPAIELEKLDRPPEVSS
jgi:anti-anti-sigma factor